MDGDDWIDVWKKHFRPIHLGNIVVVPEWIEYTPVGDEKVVLLDSNMAFGTGEHETTSMCVEEMQAFITPSCVCIDVGCGSGILAISSLLLGAKTAFGVDIDPLAVKTAKENGLMNNFKEPELTFVCGDLDENVKGKYSVVVANIVADVIIRLAPDIGRFLKDDATLIVSGIICERAEETLTALKAAGFLTRDPRMKERKKYGLKGARRAPQFSKR